MNQGIKNLDLSLNLNQTSTVACWIVIDQLKIFWFDVKRNWSRLAHSRRMAIRGLATNSVQHSNWLS